MLRPILEITYLSTIIYLSTLYYRLFLNVVKLRRKTKTSVGFKNKELERAVRAHSNFCETVPFICLISFILYFNNLLYFCIPMILILSVGRYIHAKSISDINENLENRRKGMKLTIYSLFIGIIGIIFYIIQLIHFSSQAYVNTS